MGITDFNNVDIDIKDMKDKLKKLDKCIGMMYHTYHECPLPDNDKLLNWSFNVIKNLEASKPYIVQHCSIRNTFHDFNMQLVKYVAPVYEVLKRCYDNMPCHMYGSEHQIYLHTQLGHVKKVLFDEDECRLTKKKK